MNARLNIADDLVALGQLDEAEEQFRLVEAVARGPLPAAWACWRYSQRLFHSYGELWLNRGDPVRALAYAEECLELAQHNRSTKNLIKGRRLRAQALMVLGRLREAKQELCTALEGALELGNPPQLWKTHAAIGDLRRAQGRSEDARQAYREAFTVIDKVAASLTNQKLRKTFLASGHVQNIIRAASEADE
jgi:tetratricopeptide (TPR) repeat protein